MHFVRRDGNSTSKNMSHFRRIMRRGLSQNSTGSNLMRRVEENQFRRRISVAFNCRIFSTEF